MGSGQLSYKAAFPGLLNLANVPILSIVLAMSMTPASPSLAVH